MNVILTETGELSETAREIVLDLAATNGFDDTVTAIANVSVRDEVYAIRTFAASVQRAAETSICDSIDGSLSVDLTQTSRIEIELDRLTGSIRRLSSTLASVRQAGQMISDN